MIKKKRRGKGIPYFTGKPCKYGHIAMRDSHGYCRKCKGESEKRSPTYKARKLACSRKNKEKRKGYFAEYRAKNREKSREWHRDDYRRNQEIYRKKYKEYYAKNKTQISIRTRLRQAIIRRATPLWFDRSEVEKIYNERNRLTRETGIIHNIDHIIPLRGKNVCGLHVHTNLQILTKEENRRKYNKYECD